jgi:endo-1,4-beta-xylanase
MSLKTLQLRSIVLYCFILMLTLAATKTNAQLVTNGNFESSDVGIVDSTSGINDYTSIEGWLVQVANGITPPPVFEIVSDTVERGNRALKVTVHGLGTNQWDIQIVADSIPVTPGATYSYSVWAKAEKPGAQVNSTMGNYAFNEYGALRPVNLTTQWQQYTMQFTVTDDQTVIRGPIHFNYAGDTANAIYIDDLRILGINDGKTPVTVEAESGKLGSYFSTMQDGDISYITTTVNYIGQNGPGDSNRVATYQVTFQDSGNYSLFVRLRVNANGFDDDSYFYARGFGEKNDTVAADWVFNNGLAAAGFSDSSDIVDGAGGLGNGVWKWVNATKNTYSGALGDTFYVSLDSLTRTFQIASREDGLDIDKIAFGRSDLNYTVGNLDKGEPGSTPGSGSVWEGPPLASNQPKFVGNIYSPVQVNNFEAYWNQVTPENAGKWEYVEGIRDSMNWFGLDAAYNLAKDNDFPFRFHVLIYGSNVPAWMDTLQPADQLEEIREWFQAVADRYPDIDYLEVANETLPNHNPPDGNGGRIDLETALGGTGETGWDWVINAFKMAREIFPSTTKLMINDYNIMNSNSNTATYLHLIRLLQSENLIDVIGEQGHAGQTDAPVVTMIRNLDSLASTGLPIQITEFDVRGPSDAIQLQDYQRLFPAFYEHPGVEGITLWGWRAPLYIESAQLINSDGTERPALEWLRDYLDTVDVTVGVNDISEAPNEFRLYNNYPNPFNPTTNIRYSIAKTSKVTLKVYDILGNKVQTLVNEVKSPGQYTVTFNAQNLASGIYFYQLDAGNFIATKKLVLLK